LEQGAASFDFRASALLPLRFEILSRSDKVGWKIAYETTARDSGEFIER
jgi:hypothetical protein